MTKIADLLEHKPSRAIRAMIEGLRTASQRDDFAVDMTTFGYVGRSYLSDEALRPAQRELAEEHRLCFGCAATCAIFALSDKLADATFPAARLGAINGRANLLSSKFNVHVEEGDVSEFEDALDDFRCGIPVTLFQYLGVTAPEGFFSTKEEYIEAVTRNYPENPMMDDADNSVTGWYLGNKSWTEELPLIEAYVERLEAAGL